MTSRGQPEAVVFDCDGTLVDSEPIAWSAWRDLLAPHGVEVTDDDVRAYSGRRFVETYEHFAARAPLPPAGEIRSMLEAELRERYAGRLRAFGDAVDVLDAARERGVPAAVASSSPRERLDLALRTVGLTDRFAATVAGDEVTHGKPAPDLFLEAAARLRLAPAGCVAVEDTGPGVTSARRAGLWVVGVRREPGTDLADAHVMVDRLTPAVVLDAYAGSSRNRSTGGQEHTRLRSP